MAQERTIWVTRASPGAEETAARLRAMGFDPLVAPLLEIRAIPGARIDLSGIGAFAFTSANGVRALAVRSPERAIKVFAVGEATAAAASAAGFHSLISADGAVKDLAIAIAIAKARGELTGAVLHPGPAEPAGDLGAELSAHGVEVRTVALYDSVPAPVPGAVLARIGELFAALVHSPKAARALATILEAAPAPGLRVYCLSTAVARPLAALPITELAAAPSPTEEALLKLIAR